MSDEEQAWNFRGGIEGSLFPLILSVILLLHVVALVLVA